MVNRNCSYHQNITRSENYFRNTRTFTLQRDSMTCNFVRIAIHHGRVFKCKIGLHVVASLLKPASLIYMWYYPRKPRMAQSSDSNPCSCHFTKHKPPLDCHSLICAYIPGQEWVAHASDSNPCPWHFSPPRAAAGLSQCLTRVLTYPDRSEMHTFPIPSHDRDISPHHEPPLDCHRPWRVYGFHLHRIRCNDSIPPTDPNDHPLERLKKEKLLFVKH